MSCTTNIAFMRCTKLKIESKPKSCEYFRSRRDTTNTTYTHVLALRTEVKQTRADLKICSSFFPDLQKVSLLRISYRTVMYVCQFCIFSFYRSPYTDHSFDVLTHTIKDFHLSSVSLSWILRCLQIQSVVAAANLLELFWRLILLT